MSERVFIIDDEPTICNALKLSLEADDFLVEFDHIIKRDLDDLKRFMPDVVVLDLCLPDVNGLELLTEIKDFDSEIIVIMITAFGEIKSAVEAIKKGAYDFITKPFDVNELKHCIRQAIKERDLELENQRLKEKIGEDEFITRDKTMSNLLSLMESIAISDSNVLIEGETGTGKELIATTIHKKSLRANKPLIAVNSSSIPSNLFESELFGYEKSAFTGALNKKKGLIELANRGTFFLDEIGDLHTDMQSKLLRFLEERKIRRVGGLTSIPLDVRIITATNKNLKSEVEKGTFRSDLYYRLNVVSIKIPPLRNRPQDIPLLLDYYRKVYNKQFNKAIDKFSYCALDILSNYKWPGNVRELKNIVERAFILTKDNIITAKELPLELKTKTEVGSHSIEENPDEKLSSLEELEKQHIREVLEQTRWNISKASEIIGISRFALQRRIKKYFN